MKSFARRSALLAPLKALALLLISQNALAQEPTKDGDVVEVLDDGPAKTETQGDAEKKKEPAPRVDRPDRLAVRGFTRLTLAGGLGSGAGPDRVPAEERVGYERGTLNQHAYGDVHYKRSDWFQAVLSGSLAWSARMVEGAPTGDAKDRDLGSGRLEPVLREAYVGFYGERIDLRIGQQRIAWGNGESLAPNDVLNARDLRDRLQFDPEMVHLPTLAARADFDLGVAVLGLVAQPFFVPDRTAFYGRNWALVQPDAPKAYRRLFGLYAKDHERVEVEDARAAFVASSAPKSGLDGASLGASVRMHLGGVDTSFYYHWGLDRTPYVYLDPQLASRLETANPEQINGVVVDALLAQQKKASATYGGPLLVQYYRRHHVGADVATTVGPFVLRADAAFDSATTFFSRDTFGSVARPAAQAVAGVEYHTGNLKKMIMVEGSYVRVLGPELPVVPALDRANGGSLLYARDDNVGVAGVVRWQLGDEFVIETRAFLGIQPFWYSVRPEIGWETTSFSLRAGLLVIDGAANTFGGVFRRNDTAYLTARYSF